MHARDFAHEVFLAGLRSLSFVISLASVNKRSPFVGDEKFFRYGYFACVLGFLSREPKFLIQMKLIFIGTVFAVSVLSGCSRPGTRSALPVSIPLVSSTPAPTPSPLSSIDIERRKAREIVKRMDKILLEGKERSQKREEEYQKTKSCIEEKDVADFSPNDDVELSPECKKRLADLDKGSSKSH